MNKFLSIILPHSDDELFILPFVESKLQQGFLIKIFFVTSDFNPLREEESGKMLSLYDGVEVIQFGRLNKISDGKLSSVSEDVLRLLGEHSFIKSSLYLVCPTYEGGHMDHDATFKIGYALALKLEKPLLVFSLYNAYQTPFVRVSTFFQGPVVGEKEIINFSFRKGLSYLRKSFYYKSQLVILTVLFPGLFRTFLLKRRIEILKVKHFDEKIPHPGRLFYSNPWKNRIKSLLRVT